jgi:tetratricopeptide (TPR) repeat protein
MRKCRAGFFFLFALAAGTVFGRFLVPSPSSAVALKKSTATSTSTQARLNDLLKEMTKSAAALRPQEGDSDYFWKRCADLITSPFLWTVLIAALVFSEELGGILTGLRSLKIGPVELALAAIEGIKSDISGWKLTFDVPPEGGGFVLSNLASLEDYPRLKVQRTLNKPFLNLDWNAVMPRLRILEARLATQEDRLRSSPYFVSEKPPDDFFSAKSNLFTLFVCVGNLYGFARSQDGIATRPVDIETSIFYLRKAIALRPELGGDERETIGYASFCLATTSGLLGVELLDSRDPALKAEGGTRVGDAIKALQRAEQHGYSPAEQYHLKGYLLFYLEKFEESAESWKEAATRWRPPSPKMYFNLACVMSKLRRYRDALNQLELAVSISDAQKRTGPAPDFDPRRQARDTQEGAEFAAFWQTPPDPEADAARSDKGNSFQQITA